MTGLSWLGMLRSMVPIQGLSVRGARMEASGLVVEVRPRQRKPRCGECGRPAPAHDTAPARLWRHLPLGQTNFWLHYAPRRVRCREHGVSVEQVPWAAHDSCFTRDFEKLVASYQAHRMDNASICQLLGLDPASSALAPPLVDVALAPAAQRGHHAR